MGSINGQLYEKSDLDALEAIEENFNLDHFDNYDAYEFGKLIIENSHNYPCGCAIVITREEDDLTVFQYVMEGKNQKNVEYANRKRRSVLATGHSSIWLLISEQVKGKEIKDILSGYDFLPVSGAFPIYVKRKHTYTVAVSGLHDGLDFVIFLKALEKFTNKQIPMLTKTIL